MTQDETKVILKAACVEELYDAVAVLMRMIATVEGKQKLGGAE